MILGVVKRDIRTPTAEGDKIDTECPSILLLDDVAGNTFSQFTLLAPKRNKYLTKQSGNSHCNFFVLTGKKKTSHAAQSTYVRLILTDIAINYLWTSPTWANTHLDHVVGGVGLGRLGGRVVGFGAVLQEAEGLLFTNRIDDETEACGLALHLLPTPALDHGFKKQSVQQT